MDNLSSVSQTQGVFRALSDPTRREILRMLSRQDMTISEVVGSFDITRSAVKKHLDILKQGALISTHSKGRESINHLEPDALQVDPPLSHDSSSIAAPARFEPISSRSRFKTRNLTRTISTPSFV